MLGKSMGSPSTAFRRGVEIFGTEQLDYIILCRVVSFSVSIHWLCQLQTDLRNRSRLFQWLNIEEKTSPTIRQIDDDSDVCGWPCLKENRDQDSCGFFHPESFIHCNLVLIFGKSNLMQHVVGDFEGFLPKNIPHIIDTVYHLMYIPSILCISIYIYICPI